LLYDIIVSAKKVTSI